MTVLSEVIESFGGAGYVEDTGLPQLLRDAQVLPIWEGTTNVLALDTLRALGSPTSNAQRPTSGESPTSNVPRVSNVQRPMSNVQSRDAPVHDDRENPQSAFSIQHSAGGIAPAPIRTASGSDRPESQHNSPTPFQSFKSAVLNCLSEASAPSLSDPIRITQSALAHAETWFTQTTNEALEAGARRFALTLGRTMELALLIKHAQWSLDHESDARSTAAARRFATSGIDLLIDQS